MRPSQTAAVDQVMAGGNEFVDKLVAEAKRWLAAGSSEEQVFLDLHTGALASDAGRTTLAGVNAIAILRLARADNERGVT